MNTSPVAYTASSAVNSPVKANGDLDLSTTQGQRSFERRIAAASRMICGSVDRERDVARRGSITKCLAEVRQSAEPARIVGCVALGRHEDDVVLGYWIAREHWGQGYATEAARAVLQLAKVLGHQRIVANHFVDNPASGRVLRKLGFCPTGRVEQRLSAARGEPVQALEYVRILGEPCDCDDDPSMRRAA